MTENIRYVASKEQVSADLMGEAVILDTRTGVYYGLNPIGVRVWELVQEPATLNQICDAILEEYEVSREMCERDVQALLQRLNDVGLVESLK